MDNAEGHRSLVASAAAGDKAALQHLLLAHFEIIEAAVGAQFPQELAGKVDPSDIVQDVLVDVHRGIDAFQDRGEGGFVAWLRQIVENRIVSTVRHYARKKRGGDVHQVQVNRVADESVDSVLEWVYSQSNPPDLPVRRDEARQALQVCLAQLHDDQRQAVTAFYFDHRDANQIAEIMNRTPGAVRELLRRARASLEKLLGSASVWISGR